jgi:hypothetical protein
MNEGQPQEGAEPTTTNEPVDDELAKWKALARKHENANKKAFSELDGLRAKAAELEAVKAAGQSSEERIAGLDAQLSALAAENGVLKASSARAGICAKAGLAAEDIDLIPLGSEEEMTEAAGRLAKRLAASAKPVSLDGGAKGGPVKAPQTFGEAIAAARARRR